MSTPGLRPALDEDGATLDQIRLTGLAAYGYHGVLESERREGQDFSADVTLHLDTRPAAASDDLDRTVNYAAVAGDVVGILAGEPADLVETVAERIASAALEHPAVVAVDVTVHKPQAPIPVPFADVVVTIRRDRVRRPVAAPVRTTAHADAPDAPTGALGSPTGTTALDALAPHAPAPDVAAPGAHLLDPATSVAPAADLLSEPLRPAEPPVRRRSEPVVISRPATTELAHVTAPTLPPVAEPGLPPVPLPPEPSEPVLPLPPLPATELPTAPDLPPVPDLPQVPDPLAAPDAPPAPDQTDLPVGMNPAFLEDRADEGPRTEVLGFAQLGDDWAPDLLMDEQVRVAHEPQVQTTSVLDLDLDRMDTRPALPVDVVVALGANLGDAQATLRRAVEDLGRINETEVVTVAPLARTAPVGGPAQPDFLNTVVALRTTLSPRELLRACQDVEQQHGRERDERWGPRTLDVDIIVYGSLVASSDDLELPHPRAHERAFVLSPWAQILPDAVLPGLGGGPVAALAATAPDVEGVRWLALDWLQDGEPGTAGHPSAPPAPQAPLH